LYLNLIWVSQFFFLIFRFTLVWMLNSYSKIDFHNNLEKRMINSNLFTELKSDHLELTFFCLVWLIFSFFVGTIYFISSNPMTCACACKPLFPRNVKCRRATPAASEPIILYRSLYSLIVNSNKLYYIYL
jgi:hypothetical protein